MAPVRHLNNGKCQKCHEIFLLYPGFHEGLQAWFEALQEKWPQAHIACAGRGKILQEVYFRQGTSNAHFGQSAHNYNAAIDIFRLHQNGAEWDPKWYRETVEPGVASHNRQNSNGFGLKWYGYPGEAYHEYPHVEVANWKTLTLFLVEKP